MRSLRISVLAVAGLSLALALAASAGAGAVTTQPADVRGQGSGGPIVASNGATLQRSDSGLSAKLKMPTPEPGSYVYPGPNAFFPAAVPGHPEVYTLWVFVFNHPALCSQPCDSNDLFTAANGFPAARGGAFNGAGHIVGGPNLSLAGHVSMNETPFTGSPLLEPRSAEVHLAVAPHGNLDPALMPQMINLPIGNPALWWVAVFK